MTSARLFALAWRVLPHLPEVCTRALFDVAARAVHVLRIPVVGQLEANLSRLRPDLDRRALRRVSRAGMRSYLRYFGEVFTLRGLRPEQISARVRAVDDRVVRRHLDQGRSVVAALGHTGNWDLAGAWCGQHLARVLTVAEVLEPKELFEEFLRFRADLGMDVLGLTKDGSVLRTLIRRSRERTYLVPLLADRDLSRRSVEVRAAGHPMRVAPGPAALALALKAPLVQVFIRHERLRGRSRKAAGSPWGTVIEFVPIEVPHHLSGSERLVAITQAWVDVLVERIQAYPDQWHMLARVFTADLDPQRLARARAGADDDVLAGVVANDDVRDRGATTVTDDGGAPEAATRPEQDGPGQQRPENREGDR
ncbi:phosphatidylinositol mannoside acyltransferase [Pseudactinotalea sp. Z1748]|uniref:phosphatidylinositol mannoside acyltransferase n=1 Tax=Pseudactinotalea sp. Z1748 TaxID=3413027 RepID=UPI003C7D24E2